MKTRTSHRWHSEPWTKTEANNNFQLYKFRSAKSTNVPCKRIWPTLKIPWISCTFDRDDLLLWQMSDNGIIYKVEQHWRQHITLWMAHYLTLSSPLVEHRMYDTLQHEYYQPKEFTNMYHIFQYWKDWYPMDKKLKYWSSVELSR